MKTFDSSKKNVDYGDVIILYLSHFNIQNVMVKKGEITQTKFGAIKHDSLVGHQYGAQFKCTKGWVYILTPTAELWTVSLPHRTQILYSTDISMVVFQLELKPGSVVCESGTGSGSLSHSILRTIAPNGFLHTVEFHEERSKKAREEFIAHGYEKNVTVYHRDVYNEGFPIVNAADAVFLDVPKPELAVPQAIKALKKSGSRFCSFSPCMEQVQRTCELLHQAGSGFSEIITIELVKQSHNVKRINMPIANMGNTAADHVDKSWPYKVGDQLTVGEVTDRNQYANTESEGAAAKKMKTEDGEKSVGKNKSYTPLSVTDKTYTCRTCVSPKEIYGHTGYLTFATYRIEEQ